MSEREAEEKQEREHRIFVNLVAAIAILILAISAIWLLGFLDDRRKIQTLQRFDPTAAPPK